MHHQWFGKYEDLVRRWLEGRLFIYPVLTKLRDAAVAAGLVGTRAKSAALPRRTDYFLGPHEYHRWLRVTGYRETLRVLLLLKPIEAIVAKVTSDESRRLLRWSYIDQLTENDIARMLCLATNDHHLVDDFEARRRIILAYESFCCEIEKLFPTPNRVSTGRYVEYESVFPAPPNVLRIPSQRGAK